MPKKNRSSLSPRLIFFGLWFHVQAICVEPTLNAGPSSTSGLQHVAGYAAIPTGHDAKHFYNAPIKAGRKTEAGQSVYIGDCDGSLQPATQPSVDVGVVSASLREGTTSTPASGSGVDLEADEKLRKKREKNREAAKRLVVPNMTDVTIPISPHVREPTNFPTE
jgi:hypothetical protein